MSESVGINSLSKLMSKEVHVYSILILAAISHGLRLDKEIRSIEECIRRAVRRDSVNILTKTAVRPQDIRRALAEEKPQIVHFCGHGLEDGSLLLEDDGGQDSPVSPQGLAALFELHKDYVKCVLLNACHSVKAAIAISEHINYAIGMNQQIQDNSAIKFSEGFYDALGYPTLENVDGFQRAFEEGIVAIKLENPSSAEIPVMKTKVNTAQTVIFGNAPRRSGIPFQAPPLPNYYVDRPEYTQDLKNRLLTSQVTTLVITAIHGLGSVGKSTLATALAHDKDVQAHFCDGILWATLGQQPNLLSLLSGWVQALGDYNFKATSVEAASMQLRTLVYDKAVLLVVDDAWNTEDAQAFNVGGARCQVLVTTREAAIAQILCASTYRLDVMKPSQAMELLTKKIGRVLTEIETQEAQALAKAVGYLPLALELVAAEVASGTTWTELLKDFQQEVARLKTLDRPEAEEITDEAILKRFSLLASLNLSVKRMPTKKQEYFCWLGVLPEDVTITKMMAATLWKMDIRDTAKTLQYLQNKALLLSGVPLGDSTPTYRLHDLFHDLARNLLIAPPNPEEEGDLPGLGITLPAAHATFLQKYRNQTSKNLWHTLPSDGYIHQHLVWHLEKAEKVEEIHQLLAEESATGSNGWYEACDRLGQTANFVTDVARAWQLAEDSWTKTTLPQFIGLQCRYALIIASLNSLAANLPLELLIALVQKNVWTPEQGLAYVLQSSNPAQKANLLTQLANHLPPNLKELALSKALAAARSIQDEYSHADVLIHLALQLPSELLPEVVAAARSIHNKSNRADVLIHLALQLPELLPEALAPARSIHNKSNRAYALSSLALQLPELLPETLAAARSIHDKSNRAYALSRLVCQPLELLLEALAAAREKKDESSRTYALSSLAVQLPELLPEALTAARSIQDEYSHADVLIRLALQLPELLPEALTAARSIQNESDRFLALIRLSEKLPELLPEALAAAREIKDEWSRANALRSLAEKLPELLPEALTAARSIQNEAHRAYALSSLAEKLPSELLPETVAAARSIQNEAHRAYALNRLAVQLPELLPEALTAVRSIQNETHRTDALSSLAVQLPELLPEALTAVRSIQEEYYRVKALSSLAVQLPELLPEALTAARSIQEEYYRVKALSSLAEKLPSELLPEALTAARSIQDERHRADALSSLAEKNSELLPEVLTPAREIKEEYYRVKALSSLAVQLPELLPEVLTAVRSIQDETHRAKALSSLAVQLPELLPEALTAARSIQEEYYRANALSGLAVQLPSDLLPEALTAARSIHDESNRAHALRSLAVQLPELLPEALAAARSIHDESNRAHALRSLVLQLPELLPEALAAAREIKDEWSRANALSSLAEKLPELLPEALAAAREIKDESSRAHALRSLAFQLPGLLPEALAAAMEIKDEYYRAHALSRFAFQLPELVPKLLAAAMDIQDEYYRFLTLSSLAEKLPELLPKALAAAMEIQDESAYVLALGSLAVQLPELLPEALPIVRSIWDEYYRAKALIRLAVQLPELLPEVLTAARSIEAESDRADALSSLALQLSQIQKTALFAHWRETLHILSVHTRPNLLRDISALTPVIFTLGGKEAVKDTAFAIQDVSRWWC